MKNSAPIFTICSCGRQIRRRFVVYYKAIPSNISQSLKDKELHISIARRRELPEGKGGKTLTFEGFGEL
jgi:hypothetical protein